MSYSYQQRVLYIVFNGRNINTGGTGLAAK